MNDFQRCQLPTSPVTFQLCNKIILTSLVGVCFIVSLKPDWATWCNMNLCPITTTSFLTHWKKQLLTIITAENQTMGIQQWASTTWSIPRKHILEPWSYFYIIRQLCHYLQPVILKTLLQEFHSIKQVNDPFHYKAPPYNTIPNFIFTPWLWLASPCFTSRKVLSH